jgi:hypothetical protein
LRLVTDQPTDRPVDAPVDAPADPAIVPAVEPVATVLHPRDPRADPTPPRPTRQTGPVQYKGSDLEPARGPGLGCFRIQVVVLVVFIILTPLTVVWDWPPAISTALLFAVILLLLVTGQTIIFLLRLVAADRRGRRRPLASGSKTVGELEDASVSPVPDERSAGAPDDRPASDDTLPPEGPVRQ